MSEPNIQDVLEAISDFSGSVDQRFESMDARMNRMESQMVTKDYLDEKLADLRGVLA